MDEDSIINNEVFKYCDFDMQLAEDKNSNDYMCCLQYFGEAKKLLNDSEINFNDIRLNLIFNDAPKLNVFLEVEKRKAGVEIESLKQEFNEIRSISTEETQSLIDRMVLIEHEKSKTERILCGINKTKLLYKHLNLDIQRVSIDIYILSFLDKSGSIDENSKKFLKIQIKNVEDRYHYRVLEQSGLSQDVFLKLNHQLMVTDDIILFLVNVKNN